MKRRLALAAATAAAVLALSSCAGSFLPKGREIDRYEIVTAMGIDKLDGLPAVTVSSQREKNPFILTGSGMTVASAVAEMNTYSQNMLILSNIKHILVGEKALEGELAKYLDYAFRQPSIRLDTKLYAVHGATARKVLTEVSTADDYITNRLNSFEKDIRDLSPAEPVTLSQVMSAYAEDRPLLMPSLVVVDKGKHSESEKDQPDMELGGLVILLRGGAAGYIEPVDVPGCSFVLGDPTHCVIEVRDDGGKLAALNVTYRSTELSLEFGEDGAAKKLNVAASLPVIVAETHSGETVSREYLLALKAGAESVLGAMMKDALTGAQKAGLDYLRVGERLGDKNRKYMDEMSAGEWNRVFSGLEVSVSVSSDITHSYDVAGPLGGKEQ